MSGEDQERFEDYLELEHFIAELQAGHKAYPPQELTPAQARVYRMASLFHTATPGVGEPDADFAARLQMRLEQEGKAPAPEQAPEVPPIASSPPPKILRPQRRVPRRFLLTGGATAAASLVVGASAEYMLERVTQAPAAPPGPTTKNGVITVKLNTPLDWFPVTTVAEVSNQAIKFRAEDQSGNLSLIGYVVRDGNAAQHDQIIAMSAACTHKGCIVEWSGADRRFHCPCHGGVFAEDGGTDTSSSVPYLEPLPRLDVKIENGQIYVRMPAS